MQASWSQYAPHKFHDHTYAYSWHHMNYLLVQKKLAAVHSLCTCVIEQVNLHLLASTYLF